jgi:acetoacetyl-CoA synthetase
MQQADRPLWQPSQQRIAAANLTAFMRYVRERCGVDAADYTQLYAWSTEDLERFWDSVWSF